jgi:hypothetical protein
MRVGGFTAGEIDGGDREGLWQLRVPLAEGQYVNVYVDRERELHPIVLNQFPKVVERYLAEHPAAQTSGAVKAI